MDGRRSQLLIPIACRFVASDQWLTTQFDATLKISEVKQYILTKVYNSDGMTSDYLSSRDRPVSPITFASVLPSPDSFDDSTEDSHEDERVADPEIHIFLEPTRQPRGRQAPKPRLASPTTTEEPPEPEPRAAMLPPHRYQMLAFSTGQLLEDDYSLSWYRLRPHELLELHPPDTMVRLPREVMLEYIQPYLELDVRALRVVVNAKDAHSTSYLQDVSSNKIKKARDPSGESRGPSGGVGGPAAPPSIRKRRKMKLEWRDRYLVIRQGMLSLFKSRSDLTPVHTCLLSSLTTLRGQEGITHAAATAFSSPHIVCAKFRVEVSTSNVPDSQPSSSPTAEQWKDPWSGGTIPRENDGGIWGKRESKESIKHRSSMGEEDMSRGSSIPREDQHEHRTPEHRSEGLLNEINADDGTQGIWLVLDTLNEFALSHLLRVLHRFCPDTISSTLIPNYLLPDSSLSSSPSSPSPPPFLSVTPQRPPYPYPEWRIEVSQRAQKAGLGDVSQAMGWILWGGSSEEPSSPKPSDPELSKKGSPLPAENSHTVPDIHTDDADCDDDDYEFEWDSWPQDLVRQARSAPMDKHIAVSSPEPLSAHALHPHGRLGLARSISNMNLSAPVGPVSPALRQEILSSANMDLLSVDSPALLTAPGVLPLQGLGVTTSTVSVGDVVRTRSLMSVDGGRVRGVARAMEVPADSGGGQSHSPRKQRAGKQKRTRDEYYMSASATSTMCSSVSSPTSTVRSTLSALDMIVPSPTQSLVSPPTLPGGGATSTMPVSGCSSTAVETPPPVTSSDKAGKGKKVKNPSRRPFTAERLVSKIS